MDKDLKTSLFAMCIVVLTFIALNFILSTNLSIEAKFLFLPSLAFIIFIVLAPHPDYGG